jgi:hypothetical protein
VGRSGSASAPEDLNLTSCYPLEPEPSHPRVLRPAAPHSHRPADTCTGYGLRLDSSALTILASSTRRTFPLPVSGKESKKRTMSGTL